MSRLVNERLTRTLLEAVVIVAVGVVVGLSVNHQLVLDDFAGRLAPVSAPAPRSPARRMTDPAKQPPTAQFPAPIDLDGLRAELQEGAVAVDARSPEAYREGHLPGAQSLFLGEVRGEIGGFFARVPKTARLITYCNGYGCPDAFDLGVTLLASGYRDVLVFEGGYPAWRDAGLPTTQGAAP